MNKIDDIYEVDDDDRIEMNKEGTSFEMTNSCNRVYEMENGVKSKYIKSDNVDVEINKEINSSEVIEDEFNEVKIHEFYSNSNVEDLKKSCSRDCEVIENVVVKDKYNVEKKFNKVNTINMNNCCYDGSEIKKFEINEVDEEVENNYNINELYNGLEVNEFDDLVNKEVGGGLNNVRPRNKINSTIFLQHLGPFRIKGHHIIFLQHLGPFRIKKSGKFQF